MIQFLGKVYEKALDKQLETGEPVWRHITLMLNRSFAGALGETVCKDELYSLKERLLAGNEVYKEGIDILFDEVIQIEEENAGDSLSEWKQRRKKALLHGRPSTLSHENIGEFLEEIYTPFYGSKEFSLNPDELASDIPLETMRDCFRRLGVVPLRRWESDWDTLVIGCGNLRQTGCDGEKINDLFYAKEHEHEGQVTISPDLCDNPHLLAFVGSQFIAPYFQGKKFKRVIFEGFFPFPRMRKEFCRDLNKIADGNILFVEGGKIINMTEKFRNVYEDVVFFSVSCE